MIANHLGLVTATVQYTGSTFTSSDTNYIQYTIPNVDETSGSLVTWQSVYTTLPVGCTAWVVDDDDALLACQISKDATSHALYIKIYPI